MSNNPRYRKRHGVPSYRHGFRVTAARLGAQLAEALVDDPHRFRNGKQMASYLGLVPRQYQSGQMNRQGRISGQGDQRMKRNRFLTGAARKKCNLREALHQLTATPLASA